MFGCEALEHKSSFHRFFGQVYRKLRKLMSQPPRLVPIVGYADRKTRHGIVGIERSIESKNEQASKKIDAAFEDLSNLMKLAKDMVSLSKRISESIQSRTGAISDDETIQFKSYLLSLGVDDPVTREGSKSMYFADLARELAKVLNQPIKEAGGMMSLSEAYCRINRARGFEMISPDDLIDACTLLEKLNLPIRFVKFRSGAMALQSIDYSESKINLKTKELVEEHSSISAHDLARLSGISVILAMERLLSAEQAGMLCRDDSMEGLIFYPNLFLQKD